MTDTARWIRLGVVIVVVGFGACKDDGFGNVPQSEAPATVAEALCDQAQACDCFAGTDVTVDLCRSSYEQQWQGVIDAGQAEGLIYDGECLGKYLDAFTAFGCATDIDEQDAERFDDECAACKYFYGTKQAGEPCELPGSEFLFLADECARGLSCNGEQCVDPCERRGEGESCSTGRCADGLTCHYTFDPETEEGSAECRRPAGRGDDCTELPCGDDLDCDYETFTCVDREPPPGAGEPCTGDCAEGLYCDTGDIDSSAWVCAPQRGEGEACSTSSECRSWDCEDDVCVPAQPIACIGGF